MHLWFLNLKIKIKIFLALALTKSPGAICLHCSQDHKGQGLLYYITLAGFGTQIYNIYLTIQDHLRKMDLQNNFIMNNL